VLQLRVTSNVVPTSLILFVLMMEAILSSETSVVTRDAQRHIPGHGVMYIMKLSILMMLNVVTELKRMKILRPIRTCQIS
jgi:hypothetical protein